MTYLRPRLVCFMLRYKTYLCSYMGPKTALKSYLPPRVSMRLITIFLLHRMKSIMIEKISQNLAEIV